MALADSSPACAMQCHDYCRPQPVLAVTQWPCQNWGRPVADCPERSRRYSDWWRKGQRARFPTRPLSQGQIKREEALKRQAWIRYRSWSRITSGVLLSVMGAVQYGTSKVFYKVVPHFDAQELRQYIHQVMATFRKTEKEVVMVVDRSGIHRAHKLDATLDHYQGKFRFHMLPAHCGHHLNPIEGFWRVMKDEIGAGRCFRTLHQLYWRTRQVLMAHQERPIYEFHW